MQKKSIIIGVIIGLLIVGIPAGAIATIDKLQGLDTPETTVERINDTHAAITWTTNKPSHAYVKVAVSRECGLGWGTKIKEINLTSSKRTHLIIAPIYDLNESRIDMSSLPGNGSLKWYEVRVTVVNDHSGAIGTIFRRNLSQACQ